MKIELRAWETGDVKDLAAAMNNKKVQDNLRDGIPYPYSISDAKAFISAMLSVDKDKVFAWAITADNIAIGSIGVFRKDNVHYRTAEMGYYIAEPWWGKGIGTYAVKEACRYVFENTDIIRIFAEPFSTNNASCRVLEKAGFVQEGLLKMNAFKNGEIKDMKLYALVKEPDKVIEEK